MTFFKDFQYGYRLVAKYRTKPTPRSMRFPYLDGIPQRIPLAQIIKRLMKQTFLTLTLAIIAAVIWGTGGFFFILGLQA